MEERRQMDEQLRDLIEIMHFTENVSARIHRVSDEAQIYKAVKEEFAKSRRYNVTIFLLTDDGLRLRPVETSIRPGMVRVAEKVTGFKKESYTIDLNKSSILGQVVREGRTVQVKVSSAIGELFPQPLASLLARLMGYEKTPCIVTPLKRQGNIIGALMMSSTQLAEYLIPSVRNLAQHISAALELAQENAEHRRMEEALRTSEARLKNIFAASPDSITVSDLNGTIVDCNQASLDLEGYSSKNEVVGRNSLEFIARKDHSRAMENMRKTLEQGIVKNLEYTLVTKDGREFPAELSASVIRDASGAAIGFVGITKDITERKRAEEELKLRAQLLDAVTDSVCVADSNGDIIYVSEAAYRSRGYGKDELLKMNLYELNKSAGFEEARIRELFEKGEATFEGVDVRKDKSIMPVEVHARTIETGGSKLVLAVARDITERKKVEEMKDRFMSAATHELRTPLVSIKGYVDYILTGKLGPVPEKARSGLEVVKRNTDQLLRITDDLLDIQRLAFGRLPLHLEPLRFREVVDHCASEIQPFLDEKKQGFHLEGPEGPLLIQGDRVRLSQVVMNLLSNAAKFTPQGGSITLRVEDKEDTLQIQVCDTGIGIRKEDFVRIFQPFADIKKPAYIKGTGLGLSVAKGLVEAHGGRLWAHSDGEGRGSTFTFTLPKAAGKGAN